MRSDREVNLPKNEISKAYGGDYPRNAAHHGLTLSKDESQICIVGTASDYVALVDASSMEPKALIHVGRQPSWAINSRDGQYCYVSSREDNSVAVVSYETGKVVKKISTGNYPQRMTTALCPKFVEE